MLWLNPKLWIGLLVASVIGATHFGAYRLGGISVQQEWDNDRAEAQKLSRQAEQRKSEIFAKATANGTRRSIANRASSDASRAALDGLRVTLDDTRRAAEANAVAGANRTKALESVFLDCTKEYRALGEIADRLDNDRQTLIEAWH